MKYFLSLLIMSFFVKAQAQSSEQLDVNNINARINFLAPLFQDINTSNAGFEVPKGSGRTSIYSAGFWMGGLDGLNQLRVAVNQFGLGSDFKGACDTNFNRLFKVDGDSIDFHVNNYTTPGYSIPLQIAEWPAHGNTNCGMPQDLAPFVDLNSNGVYEPALGDYPRIKGDQAVWWYMTDSTTHTESGGLPFVMDMRCMAYAYDCHQDSALMHTVFVDYELTNVSGRDYFDVWVGNWVDFDIGCSGDDYVGCHVEKGVFYGYNGDANDNSGCNGAIPYGTFPPAMGAMIFGPKMEADGLDNLGPSPTNNYTVSYASASANNGVCYKGNGLHYSDGIVDNERLGLRKFMHYTGGSTPAVYTYPQGDPSSPIGYYRYLAGLWQNGDQLVYGGGGYSSNPGANSAIECDYAYPGNSDPEGWGVGAVSPSFIFDWTEWNTGAGPNPKGDRRALGSSGPFTFIENQTETITFAYVFGRDYVDSSHTASIDVLVDRADYINGFVEQGLVCGQPVSVQDLAIEPDHLELYPNPVNDFVNLKFKTIPANIEVYDQLGKLLIVKQPKLIEARVNVSTLPAGIYFIKVTDQEKVVSTQRFVKH